MPPAQTIIGTLLAVRFSPDSPASIWFELLEIDGRYQVCGAFGFAVDGAAMSYVQVRSWLAAPARIGQRVRCELVGVSNDQADRAELWTTRSANGPSRTGGT